MLPIKISQPKPDRAAGSEHFFSWLIPLSVWTKTAQIFPEPNLVPIRALVFENKWNPNWIYKIPSHKVCILDSLIMTRVWTTTSGFYKYLKSQIAVTLVIKYLKTPLINEGDAIRFPEFKFYSKRVNIY